MISSRDIPQSATKLETIRAALEAVAAGATTARAIAEVLRVTPRNAAYQLTAARALGWLRQEGARSVVSPDGRAFLATPSGSDDEYASFVHALTNSPIVESLTKGLDPGSPSALADLTRRIRTHSEPRLSEATARERARTLLAWLERARQIPLSMPRQAPSQVSEVALSEYAPSQICVLESMRMLGWKSFHDATLNIDPLTLMIGTNAAGKSNALDALVFLNRCAQGITVEAALAGDPSLEPIRGGVEWAPTRPSRTTFALEVTIGSQAVEYGYRIEVAVAPRVQVVSEALTKARRTKGGTAKPLNLFRAEPAEPDSPSITAYLYNTKAGTRKDMRRSASLLSQLTGLPVREEIREGVQAVAQALRGIFLLDPLPSRMRSYWPLAEALRSDGSNVAGVIAALAPNRRAEIERVLAEYASQLPERDVRRVWAEKAGKFGSDAMLYCEEAWVDGDPAVVVDARGMSDGTLRFIAILTALLTRPVGSLLVVEEIDNGLHPSRSGLLLEMLRTVGKQRRVDVLVTTHNRALLDALGPEMLPFLVVAHRDPVDGMSLLTPVEDLANIDKLLASATLGEAVASRRIEESLRRAHSHRRRDAAGGLGG